MNIRLRGLGYKMTVADLPRNIWGECDPPIYKRREIRLSPSLTDDKKLLEIIIHECLHGCCWDIDEEVVKETSADIAKVLHRLGARVNLEGKVKPKRKR